VATTQQRTGAARPDQPAPRTVIDAPLVTFGRALCGDLDAGLRREWLVTNGLGGYASGTLGGIATRRYHGLLVAALDPPVGRTVVVGGMVEVATCDGDAYPLSAHEYGDGTVTSHGYRNLESFSLEGTLPVWRYAVADALLERRLWMPHGANTTYLSWRLVRGSRALTLDLTPLVTHRGFHSLSADDGWQPAPEVVPGGVVIQGPGSVSLRLLADRDAFQPSPDWYWNFHFREEAARGLDSRSNQFAPGTFSVTLEPGSVFTLVFTTDAGDPEAAPVALAAEQARQRALLDAARCDRSEPALQQLTLAADQFVVERWSDGQAIGKSIIAGYHWFNDWGRDTMISLPGLTLATGRAGDAAEILRIFAGYIADGLLPNNFPDSSGAIPGYNTADATLWYVIAIHAYVEATGDLTLVADLLPRLRDIIQHHIEGTRYGIGADPEDGLLRAGEPGVQLTWMDAKVGDWVVTPRMGKPVEINALWYNALRIVAQMLSGHDPDAAADLVARAERARASFRARFLGAGHEGLADVIDGPSGDDWTVRPNQVFALSLPYPLVEGDEAKRVLEAASRALLTSLGPRSLTPRDPAYREDYGGDTLRRDGGYHQGPVWSWLTGALVDAHLRVHGDRAAAMIILRPFVDHLSDAGLGSISEIAEGLPPHLPRGCVAQAWSVAEVLRVWRLLDPA
jgi:predicted glycogen debranching enzyme